MSSKTMTLIFVSALLSGGGLSAGGSAEATPILAPEGGESQTPAEITNESGVVLETMDSGGYTYVRLALDDREIWAATQRFKVEVGDAVVVFSGVLMTDFHSPTLNRNFESIYFAGQIVTGNPYSDSLKLPAGHFPVGRTAPSHPSTSTAESTAGFSDLEKSADGYTVAEIHERKTELASRRVTVRGKVVKFNSGILGTNWLHIQDGTGNAGDGTNDLTVTSQATAPVGQIVLVVGTLELDKDFGAGYRYDAIITEAELKIEQQ